MTRLWPEGVAIAVDCDDEGRPARLRWRGRTHTVTHVARAWQVDLEWWRQRIWRRYFKVSTDTGLLLVIFQDLAGGDWFLQRLYD